MKYDLSDPAVHAIMAAKVTLLLRKPFFGQLVAGLDIVDASKWCRTAATDGKYFYYNREFIINLNHAELLFLMGHEVLHCFPAGTLIPGSWKPIEELRAGDVVVGLGGVESTVTEPMSAFFDGDLYTIKARGLLALQMTDEHPVFRARAVWRSKGSHREGNRTNTRVIEGGDFVAAKDVRAGDWVQVPRLKGTISNYEMTFDLKANAWSSPIELQSVVTLDQQIAEFLGWYVAEGSTSISGGKFVSCIALHAEERQVAENLQSTLATCFGVASSIQPHDQNGVVLQFSSAPLGRWLQAECGHGATQKRIPQGVLNNTDLSLLAAFLRAYLSGDGHADDKSVNFGTASLVLAQQLQIAGARLGFLFGLHKRRPASGVIRGRPFQSKALYHGYTSSPAAHELMGMQTSKRRPTSYCVVEDDAIWTPVTEVSHEEVIGLPIYNIETSCHTYAAGNMMTHNCVYEHLGRRGHRDPLRFNMACDYVVNSTLINEKIGKQIKGALVDKVYNDTLSAEEIYDLLVKNSVTIQLTLDDHLEVSEDGDDDDGQDGDGKGGGSRTVEVTVQGKDGPPKLSKKDIEKLRDDVRSSVIRAAHAAGADNVPASIKRLIGELTEPQMDWRALLDTHFRSLQRDDFTFSRISRRSYALDGLILPGQDFMDTIDIVISIDASGSLSDAMLKDILSEVKGICETFRDFKIKLFSFDTEVHNYAEFTPDNLDDLLSWNPGGGGGTIFSSVFEFMRREGIEPNRLVFFTDGLPSDDWANNFRDYCDTLWVIYGNKDIKAPWGMTAHYEAKNEAA